MTMTKTAAFQKYVNLADARLNSRVIHVSDEWFAPAERMLQPSSAQWQADLYDANGKWMDGWESRRKRSVGHDFAIIQLGVPGVIKGVDIDTAFFTGNYPPSASLDACFCPTGTPTADTPWQEILPAVNLQGNQQHLHRIDDPQPYSHLRLNIYPDGGIARLRVYGTPFHDWSQHGPTDEIDLAAALNGGRALACNDQHYGQMGNLLNPGRGINMGDGWETARRRTPGNDWVIIALGHPGEIRRIIVDTLHFKGNYPDSCSLQAAYVTGGNEAQIETQSLFWPELLPVQKLAMDQEQQFSGAIRPLGPVSHVRLNIFPDGGVSRLRLFGTLSR